MSTTVSVREVLAAVVRSGGDRGTLAPRSVRCGGEPVTRATRPPRAGTTGAGSAGAD